MDPNRWKQIDELFDAALEMPEAERADFVAKSAGADHKLRDKVLELLEAGASTDTFLDRSAIRVAAKGVAKQSAPGPVFISRNLGSYRIERPIGAGGMGEVFLAFDEKLKRRIALKILPPEFHTDDQRVKRFELEARAISSLNHPGIVTIFDVGHANGVSYIATEFVEGKTLRELIGGNFKIRNIVLNSIQICDALAAAHANGIIHRDIKPENIMIRKDGYAKILDFGLAKLTDHSEHSIPDLEATSKGAVIGTPGYMSPEQVSGDAVDHRTDLWSSGVVLYEFLTGKNPFKGATRQDTVHAIISLDPPPCSSLNPEVPPQMDRIIAKLLSKEREQRYQTAADLRVDLKEVQREIDSSASGETTGGYPSYQRRRHAMYGFAPAAAIALLLSGLFGAGYYFLSARQDPAAIDWSAAQSVQLTDQPGTEYFPNVSPDGKEFVYAAREDGDLDIFIQRIGGRNRVNLTADSAATDTQPAFSPDGEHIAFRSERSPEGIYIMSTSGENPKLISDVGFHPSWSPDGKEIVVSSFGRDQPTVRNTPGENALYVINIETGDRRTVSEVEASFPTWSPSGHRIAYWFYTGTFGRRDVATIPASGGEPVVVAKNFAVSNWNPVWSPDGQYLYFVSSRAGNLSFWRVRIDESTGRPLAAPEAVITPAKYSRHLSFSRDGKRLVYVQTNDRSNIRGVEFDPGRLVPVGDPFWITQGDRRVARAEMSPDGSQFVMRLDRTTQEDLVTVSRDGSEWRDITNDESFERYVRWSPDGKRLAFISDREEGSHVWAANADGTNLKRLTFGSSDQSGPGFPIWSPDGDRLAFYFNGATKMLNPTRTEMEQQVTELPKHPRFRIVAWDWSPDGKKLAGIIADGDRRHVGFYDLETNEYGVVVEDLNEVPSWSPDSHGLLYSLRDKVFLADIVVKTPIEIFSDPGIGVRSPFVSRDGKLLYFTAATAESDIWLLDLTASP